MAEKVSSNGEWYYWYSMPITGTSGKTKKKYLK